MSENFKCGAVAVLGKPNVGKSTLTNLLVGQKISIVSDKKQTTRKQIRGIVTTDEYQIVLIDTPGLHEPHTTLQKVMNEDAQASLADVDLVLVVVDAHQKPDKEDEALASLLKKAWKYPWAEEDAEAHRLKLSPSDPSEEAKAVRPFNGVLLCLNKMDLLKAEDVVDRVEDYCKLFGTDAYMLTCLTKRQNYEKLLALITDHLQEGEALFPEDMVTDSPMRFMAAELIREKALALTRQEVPHSIGCVVDHWEETNGKTTIIASLICEKDGQKAILIGKKGAMAKEIGTLARAEIEDLLEAQVFLELHVKVRPEWRQNPRMLHELDYM